jgi:hypothetical protein
MTRIATAICSLAFVLPACKSGEKSDAPAPAAKAEAADTAGSTAPTSSETPAEDPRAAAAAGLKEAIRLSPAFTEKFLAALESNDEAQWLALQPESRRAQLQADDAVRKSLDAWRRGTLTKADQIRKAEHMIALNPAGGYFLAYKDVMVANDPENLYKITVVIENGEMLIGEL